MPGNMGPGNVRMGVVCSIGGERKCVCLSGQEMKEGGQNENNMWHCSASPPPVPSNPTAAAIMALRGLTKASWRKGGVSGPSLIRSCGV